MEPTPARAEARKTTEKMVILAQTRWGQAPIHIQMMAGAYVTPLMAAMLAINDELHATEQERQKTKIILLELIAYAKETGVKSPVLTSMDKFLEISQ